MSEVVFEFLVSSGDGFLVHSRDLGEEAISSITESLGFMGDKPAALLFIHAAEEQIDTLMPLFFRLIDFLLADVTLANVHFSDRHGFLVVELAVRDLPILHQRTGS
jgi:hypothetical protein